MMILRYLSLLMVTVRSTSWITQTSCTTVGPEQIGGRKITGFHPLSHSLINQKTKELSR